MSEFEQESTRRLPVFHITLELVQHLPEDHQFYVIWSKKEMTIGMKNLQIAIADAFNEFQSFMDRKMRKDGT